VRLTASVLKGDSVEVALPAPATRIERAAGYHLVALAAAGL